MARYHFNLRHGGLVPDPDGEELPDLQAARTVAAKYLAEMLKERSADIWAQGEMCVTVSDPGGDELFNLTLVASSRG